MTSSGNPSVRVWFESAKIKVLDPELSEDKRAQVQKTMEGPDVLDVKSYPEIRFRSTAVETAGNLRWKVRGTLALHGATRGGQRRRRAVQNLTAALSRCVRQNLASRQSAWRAVLLR